MDPSTSGTPPVQLFPPDAAAPSAGGVPIVTPCVGTEPHDSGESWAAVGSLAVAFAIYRLGRRINLARFFGVVGALLMVFAAGLLVDAVENLQQLGWLPLLTHPLWSTAHVLSEDSTLGDLFHTFFGYAERPTVLQVVVYVVYAAVAIGAYFRLTPSRWLHRQVVASQEG